MNLTKMNLIASHYYKCQRRREKRMEARRRKRRCPPAPPPSPASPPPPPPLRSPSPPLPRSLITAPAKSRTLTPAPAQSQPPVPAPLRSQTPAMEPPQSRSPTPPVKQKTARVRAYSFNSSDSDYSPNVDHDKSDSDSSTPRKRAKLFSDTDEIKILKGLLYMNKKNDLKTSVTDEVAEHINRSLRRRNADFTKTQFRSKIRRMKEKYNKNRDKEGKFYKLCAKIWGENKEEEPRLFFENDSCVVADTNVVDFMDESNVDDLYVEDSYAEYSENNNEHHDHLDQEVNDDLIARRAENKRKFKELDIMTLELSLKRLALMKETIGAGLEV